MPDWSVGIDCVVVPTRAMSSASYVLGRMLSGSAGVLYCKSIHFSSKSLGVSNALRLGYVRWFSSQSSYVYLMVLQEFVLLLLPGRSPRISL